MIKNGRMLEVRMNGRTYHCALDITMDYLGGKWKVVVLWYLKEKPQRFSELKRLMPEITEKMLSLQLKKMEEDGLVARRVYAEVPPKVEYSLTPEGKTLIPALNALASWGRKKAEKDGKIVDMPVKQEKPKPSPRPKPKPKPKAPGLPKPTRMEPGKDRT